MKPLLAAALALALSAPVLAKEGPPKDDRNDPKARAAEETERLKEHLELSDEQAKKVGDIVAKNIDEKISIEKKFKENERRTHEAVRAVLNDEQKERFDMMRAARMMGPGGGMGRRGMRGRKGAGKMRRRGPGGQEPAEGEDELPGPDGGPKVPPPPEGEGD